MRDSEMAAAVARAEAAEAQVAAWEARWTDLRVKVDNAHGDAESNTRYGGPTCDGEHYAEGQSAAFDSVGEWMDEAVTAGEGGV